MTATESPVAPPATRAKPPATEAQIKARAAQDAYLRAVPVLAGPSKHVHYVPAETLARRAGQLDSPAAADWQPIGDLAKAWRDFADLELVLEGSVVPVVLESYAQECTRLRMEADIARGVAHLWSKATDTAIRLMATVMLGREQSLIMAAVGDFNQALLTLMTLHNDANLAQRVEEIVKAAAAAIPDPNDRRDFATTPLTLADVDSITVSLLAAQSIVVGIGAECFLKECSQVIGCIREVAAKLGITHPGLRLEQVAVTISTNDPAGAPAPVPANDATPANP